MYGISKEAQQQLNVQYDIGQPNTLFDETQAQSQALGQSRNQIDKRFLTLQSTGEHLGTESGVRIRTNIGTPTTV